MRVTFIVGTGLLLVATSATAAPSAAPSAECMMYGEVKDATKRTVEAELTNSCPKPMACDLSWTVTCGKSSSVTKNSAVIVGSEKRAWTASAATCEDDWSIDVTWGCKPSR